MPVKLAQRCIQHSVGEETLTFCMICPSFSPPLAHLDQRSVLASPPLLIPRLLLQHFLVEALGEVGVRWRNEARDATRVEEAVRLFGRTCQQSAWTSARGKETSGDALTMRTCALQSSARRL